MSIVYLKVKVKSLAAEARIIRKEELKHRKNPTLHNGLHFHRTWVVRTEARSAHLAYGICKGRTYQQMETAPRSAPNWKEVDRLLRMYGPDDLELPRELLRWREVWGNRKAA